MTSWNRIVATTITGLALALLVACVWAIQGCGGDVDVSDGDGEGSVVIARVPFPVPVPVVKDCKPTTKVIVDEVFCPGDERCPTSCVTVEIEECKCDKELVVKRGNGKVNIVKVGCVCGPVDRNVCFGGE